MNPLFQSISFHEGGKRHKLNVAKRITEISKKSIKDEKAKQKVDMQIRQMEDAAMRAYTADIHSGADMTSRAIRALNAATESATTSDGNDRIDTTMTVSTNGSVPGPAALPRNAIDPLMPPVDILEEEEMAKRERMKRKASGLPAWSAESGEGSMWCEAKSDEGHTYYWNVKTGSKEIIFLNHQLLFFLFGICIVTEAVWEPPKEGYMSIEEYNRINSLAEKQQQIKLQQDSMYMRGNADEIVAKYVCIRKIGL